MADQSPPVGLGGLSQFELPTIFRCAVELAEAAAAVKPSEWAALPVDIEGPPSPHFERWMERHSRLRRIEEETHRIKRVLGATGPLNYADLKNDDGPKWEAYDQHFNNSTHDRIVRLALRKLATAAIDLSGFTTWREWQWTMRETGLRLLAWGLAQLWEGMSAGERSAVRDRLSRTHRAIGWPSEPTADPRPYDGPEEIPLQYQYRIISKYVSCYRGYLNDVQKADNMRVEQGQERFLRQATPDQFVETAERAALAIRAMAKGDFDTPDEWGELYTKAFWPLACLRRAHEIPPREAWPAAALEQRKLLAEAADILLTCVGATPEAKAALNPADADKTLADFTRTTSQLREQLRGRSLACPADLKLMRSHALRTPTQLLEAFARAAAQFPAYPRMVAFLNSAREDGLVTVPSSFVPRKADGQPVVDQLNIGGTSKTDFGPDATFYGIGGAQMASETGSRNVGFVLYGAGDDEAARTFRELGGEAGVVVHVHDLVRGIQSYDRPLMLWSLIVYETLQGSAWLSQIDGIADNPALHFNPFAASVETLKRLLARNESLIERLLAGPDDVELSPRDMALLEAHLRQPVSFATIQQEKKATGHSPTEAARNKLTLIRDFNRGLQGKGHTEEPEKQSDPAPAVTQAEATPTAAPSSDASLALMRVFTNGIADDRIEKATRLLADDKLTANEKLTKIDALIPFPATASAEQLGEMLGVTKQAVLKTNWWMQNRKGEKENEVGRRREGHRKRAKSYEAPSQDDDD